MIHVRDGDLGKVKGGFSNTNLTLELSKRDKTGRGASSRLGSEQ